MPGKRTRSTHDKTTRAAKPSAKVAREDSAAAPIAGVVRFPTTRKRAWPRPRTMPPVHPQVLQRMAEVYIVQNFAIGYPAARKRLLGLGWTRGLGKQLHSVLVAEMKAQGVYGEDDNGAS